jgi:hypothetical protein
MMFKPLTDEHGQAVLTWCLADSHARTSAAPEREQESTETEAACGSTWLGLSVRFDLASSSWKTARCLFPEDCHESSVTLPRWGMMRNGECWERTTSVLPTSGTGYGLWPTPRAANPGSRPNGKGGKILAEEVAIAEGIRNRGQKMWPTPTAQDSKNNGAPSQMDSNTKPLNAEVGGKLNPPWVEWLMGWPIGWTGLEPLETGRFQAWQHSLGQS